MKLQPRHFIAAPFLVGSVLFVVSFFIGSGRFTRMDWPQIVLVILMSLVMILVTGLPGILALKRRWEDFVKTVTFLVLLVVFSLLAGQTNELNRAIESLAVSKTSYFYVAWGMCVTIAPLVICIIAYKRFVPLILRRIARTDAKANASGS